MVGMVEEHRLAFPIEFSEYCGQCRWAMLSSHPGGRSLLAFASPVGGAEGAEAATAGCGAEVVEGRPRLEPALLKDIAGFDLKAVAAVAEYTFVVGYMQAAVAFGRMQVGAAVVCHTQIAGTRRRADVLAVVAECTQAAVLCMLAVAVVVAAAGGTAWAAEVQ
eukprot:CAMPEP_0117825226 /NCGR_PEP_ID=MMETSP0949-20121206/5360_1 /TAXON_ID=44440 /ORGANISM="Chattonella subsalsa, Strain CCMP2191" /LENGTH=162 /DNA_ID=CAMNT_0005665177 /DNA_START=186 /DNA_END=675 /DNA_ORIENTATION=-